MPFAVFADELLIAPNPNAASDTWTGSIAEAFEGGTGTADDPYLIKTGAQLALLGKNVNDLANPNTYEGMYFKLVSNIDMNKVQWTAIGSSKINVFRGIFDGDGHTIYNMMCVPTDPSDTTNYIYGGLFGRCEEAEIKNLTLEGGSVESTKYAGAFVGMLVGGRVYNCVSRLDYVTGVQVGGMVGRAEKGTTNVIEACINYGKVESVASADNAFIGGIIGAAGNLTIRYCANFGEVIANVASKYSVAGGMIGIMGASSAPVEIDNCVDAGKVAAYVGGKSGVGAGGIAGKAAHVDFGSISNSFTLGTYSCDDEAFVGGIAGITGNIVDIDNVYTTFKVACGTDRMEVFSDVVILSAAEMKGKAGIEKMGLNGVWDVGENDIPMFVIERIGTSAEQEGTQTTTTEITTAPTPVTTTTEPAATTTEPVVTTVSTTVASNEPDPDETTGLPSGEDPIASIPEAPAGRDNTVWIIILCVLIVADGAAIVVVAIKGKKKSAD